LLKNQELLATQKEGFIAQESKSGAKNLLADSNGDIITAEIRDLTKEEILRENLLLDSSIDLSSFPDIVVPGKIKYGKIVYDLLSTMFFLSDDIKRSERGESFINIKELNNLIQFFKFPSTELK